MWRGLVLALGLALVQLPGTGAGAATLPGKLAGKLAGRWLTANGDAVIELAPCGAGLCGKIVGIALAHAGDAMPDDWQGRPQCGEEIISTKAGADEDGRMTWQGTVLDPRDGDVYRARLWLDAAQDLRLRGYVGLPLFGQTETWKPFAGRILPGCRLVPEK